MDKGKEPEGKVFADDVSPDSKAVVTFPVKEIPVADDFLGGIGHAEKESGDESEEDVGRDVEGVGKIVFSVFRVTHHHGNEERERGSLEESGGEIGAVAEFAEKRPLELV